MDERTSKIRPIEDGDANEFVTRSSELNQASPPPSNGNSNGNGNNQNDTEAIRSEIERTREELGQTIDALQERLQPERIANQVKQVARDTTTKQAKQISEKVSTVVQDSRSKTQEWVQANPRMAAAIGGGLGGLIVVWFWLRKGKSSKSEEQTIYLVAPEGANQARLVIAQ